MDSEKLKKYLEDNYKQTSDFGDKLIDLLTDNTVKNVLTDIGASLLSSLITANTVIGKSDSGSNGDDDDNGKSNLELWMLQQMKSNKSFQQLLAEHLTNKGYINSIPDFYKKIFLDRRVFSRISSEQYNQQPDKKTVMKIIIGLELNVEEAISMLCSAGYNFNNHKKFDMIIKYCIENEIFNPMEIDEYLVEFCEKPLFSTE